MDPANALAASTARSIAVKRPNDQSMPLKGFVAAGRFEVLAGYGNCMSPSRSRPRYGRGDRLDIRVMSERKRGFACTGIHDVRHHADFPTGNELRVIVFPVPSGIAGLDNVQGRVSGRPTSQFVFIMRAMRINPEKF